jgi:sulfur carrier protein ThiS
MELVKVAKLGKKVEEVALESRSNVGDALKAANMTKDGFELRLNGKPVDTGATVRNGDIVTLVPQIKGGK